jgi:hypothetical protein
MAPLIGSGFPHRPLRYLGRHRTHQVRTADNSDHAIPRFTGRRFMSWLLSISAISCNGARASMVKTGARMTCSTGRAANAANSFSLRLNVLQKRQPPVTPRDSIGVAAIQQIAFTDHSKQLQVAREHGNGG